MTMTLPTTMPWARLRRAARIALVAALFAVLPLTVGERTGGPGHQAEIRTDDVTRFFQVFDDYSGRPDAEALQCGYLDIGSDGLRQFDDARIGSMQRLATAVADKPALMLRA